MHSPNVLVIGSINMDLVGYCQRIPKVGETVMGESYTTVPGGKGANQAVAAARLGAKVTMLGAVGKDSNGELLVKHLKNNGIETAYIKNSSQATGVALINVDDQGNNQIVVIPGANYQITPAVLEANRELFKDQRLVVLQLEIPLDTTAKAIELANQYQVPVMLTPAPAQKLPEQILTGVDYLIPNQHEAKLLGGNPEDNYLSLRNQIKGTLIVTLGGDGVANSTAQGTMEKLPAYQVQAVDTTGAGDAFTGGLSASLASGMELSAALKWASAAAAISVTRAGAQPSLPSKEEVEQFLGGQQS